MNGLLDYLPEDKNERAALLTGLLSAGFGAMTGKKGQPWNNVGKAGLLGLGGYGAALTLGQNNDIKNAQLEEARATGLLNRQNMQSQIEQRQLQQQRQQQLQGVLAGVQGPQMPMHGPMPDGMPMQPAQMPAGPRDYAQALAQRGFVDEAAKYGDLATKLDPKTHILNDKLYEQRPGAGLVEVGGPGKQLDYNKAFMPDGTPNRAYQEYEARMRREGKTDVNVAYGAPVAGVDKDGKPVFFQPSKDGSAPSIVPNVAPPPKENKPSVEYTKQQTGIQGVKSAIDDYRAKLKEWNAIDTLNPGKRAEMGTVYNNVMLQAKEAYNLGVLNGPDYKILTDIITDPTSGKGAITPNKSMDAQAKKLDELMTKLGAVSNTTHGQSDRREKPRDSAKRIVVEF